MSLGECLGSGGVGAVYKGMRGQAPVAVKILPQHSLDQEEQLARFQREAELLAGIKHSNIIQVLDFGHDCGVHFIVMEYFPGENLSGMLMREHRLSCFESIEIIRQVAMGMEATHNLGLIHRDLKPSNILYDRKNGLVKVIDFGLVRKAEEDHAITQEGYIVGVLIICLRSSARLCPWIAARIFIIWGSRFIK